MSGIEILPVNDFDNQIIQEWVDKILRNYQQKEGGISLPVDEKTLITVIEELKGIHIELDERRKVFRYKDEGLLIPKKGGFILRYGLETFDKGRKLFNLKARRRFTICHELAHIFFYNCNYTIPKLTVAPPEHVCHKIAMELLLPKDIVQEKFDKEYKSNNTLISSLRRFAKDANVGLYPIVIRLVEDLSLLEDVMITFWEYEKDKHLLMGIDREISYKDFKKDPKTSNQLRKFLPKYWRNRILIEAWDKGIREVALGKKSQFQKSLYIEGKRKKEGKVKSILFDIECETWRDSNQQSLLKWIDQVNVCDVLSVMKFDLNGLEKGK